MTTHDEREKRIRREVREMAEIQRRNGHTAQVTLFAEDMKFMKKRGAVAGGRIGDVRIVEGPRRRPPKAAR